MSSPKLNEPFLQLIKQNKGIIYKVARSYGKSDTDREDLFQEIVIQLWGAFDRYNDQYKLSTWMYRIALNVAISFYRKERKRIDASMPLTDGLYEIADEDTQGETDANILRLLQFITELKELDK